MPMTCCSLRHKPVVFPSRSPPASPATHPQPWLVLPLLSWPSWWEPPSVSMLETCVTRLLSSMPASAALGDALLRPSCIWLGV